ncbi:hypothetical protein F5B22DRAFT_628453 [Xylaria bambusicola]|uniref:uncharacterized protein n=1 Tax=Xylaria bambusicola TaxID=326684 RepID=UPI002007C5AF|nr:uncharacterized protein F5B22DRAFT_628453 [Xylaria bambusicola]KAI0505276.1 hypothetical protein F5B22DRAFT_628453 [Xylaria bambusicola]
MPSATPPIYSMASPSSRKRRRDDNGEVQIPFSNSTLEASQNLLSTINNNERFIIPSNRGPTSLFSVPRKAIALPVSKKFRLVDNSQREQPHNHSLHHNGNLPSTLSQSQQSHYSHGHPELPSTPSASPHLTHLSTTKTNSSTFLNPCHICHRKPTKKSDLDSFADCMGCGERACYVCIRACQGWLPTNDGDATREEDLSASFTMQDIDDEESTSHRTERVPDVQKPEQRQKKGEGGWNGEGHCSVICSRCCVESGGEGDVICLGCLAGMKGA